MISRFFIDRPIFAVVLSILILIGGIVSITRLPIAQFPDITPPTVQISAVYPGADAETVAESIAAPIEQELSGTKDLIYFQSTSSNDGALGITATFEIGTDIDEAAVEVQNRLKNAEPRLPQETVRQGITVRKASTDLLMVVALKSTNPQHDGLYLNGYATTNMLDTLKRVPGVGDAVVFGARDYSMRIWLNPDLLAAKGMTVSDVATAVREQNGLYAAGRIGTEPSSKEVELTVPVITSGRLQTPEQFAEIILRASPDGSFVKVKDVARVELGSRSYDLVGRQNGEDTTLIITYLQSGSNALQASAGIVSTLKSLEQSFPQGMKYEIPFDVTPFVRIAIEEVIKTFGEALGLVTLVVLLFLGSWRATLIPLAAVPVAIIGAFTGMLALGFSINSLTLFGLVLAIGIVVDDAIIVVENVERIMHEEHLPVREATIRAMEQVTGPIIAIMLVLSAVFLPVAFLGGLTGEMYQQFAVTIAISVLISGFVALTLSPALCAILLKKQHEKFFIFRWFDRLFDGFTFGYTGVVRQSIRYSMLTILIFGAMLFATRDLFKRVPGGFIPQEDQGYFIMAVSLPPGSSLERTSKVLGEVEQFVLAQPEVRSVVTLGGMDLLAGFTPSTNAGIMFASLKPWNERRRPDQHVNAIVGRVWGRFAGLKEALVLAFNPPAVRGLGFRAGFEFRLQNRTSTDVRELAGVMQDFIARVQARPKQEITNISGVLNVGVPQLKLDVDMARAKLRGVKINEIYDTLQSFLGTLYVNDFVRNGRIYRVQLQAEDVYRDSADKIGRFYARNSRGEMVPLSDLTSTRFSAGPNVVSRFNSFTAVQITGEPAPGYSTGDTIRVMEEVARESLPLGYGFEWSGASFQEIKAGTQAPILFALGLLVVFLVLAAQYERWSLPFAVLLSIPTGAFGAILAVYLRGISNDIYFQIGLLTLIGLSAKNAILIVEFAATLHEQGRSILDAAVEAARVRLRPFIMTSMAFVLGVLPLVISQGAGAAGRHSIGTGVMGGMLAATFLGMLFVPLFFALVQGLTDATSRIRHKLVPGVQHDAPPKEELKP